jgi:hypothetical protein
MEAETYQDGTWSTAKFNTSGHLTIVVPIGHDLSTDLLETLFHGIDSQHPWKSKYVSGDSAPSIHWTSGFKMREGEWIDRLYVIEFRPPFLLESGQFAAYHRYACTIAEKFAELKLDGVLRVWVSVEFSGGGVSYRP